MDSLKVVINGRYNTISFLGTQTPLAVFERIGRKKEKIIMVRSNISDPNLTDVEKEMIRREFRKAWGGYHHIMFIPGFLTERYYTLKRR